MCTAACAEHLLSLVSDILDFERIESNQLQLESIPFSIVEEARKAVHLLQITAGTTSLLLPTAGADADESDDMTLCAFMLPATRQEEHQPLPTPGSRTRDSHW
jgi:signal transduction histidine kinase